MSANKLVVNNVSRHFGGLVAVDNVSLTFEPGEIYCVIGPNGAGKSTLLNLICGSIPPSSGDIRFNNDIISRLPLHKIARLGIARKFQVPTVFSSLTVRENLIVAESKHQQRSISGLGTEDILALTNLHTVQNERADTLAHGLKQWLEIAMALVTRPKLLLLDEPAAGMTADETHKMAQLLVSLRGKLSIIAIEHNMRFIKELNSHTVVMHHGRIVASGAYSEIERNDMVRDIYLGRQ